MINQIKYNNNNNNNKMEIEDYKKIEVYYNTLVEEFIDSYIVNTLVPMNIEKLYDVYIGTIIQKIASDDALSSANKSIQDITVKTKENTVKNLNECDDKELNEIFENSKSIYKLYQIISEQIKLIFSKDTNEHIKSSIEKYFLMDKSFQKIEKMNMFKK